MKYKNKDKATIKIKSNKRGYAKKYTDVTTEFMKWLKEFKIKHDDALRKLAKR